MSNGKDLIDAMLGPDGVLDCHAIHKIMPYGNEFLFVDRVLRLEPRAIVAEFLIKPDLPALSAHFKDFPVMPGALITEGFAQAGTILIRYNLPDPLTKDILIGTVENARFFQPCFPGANLLYTAKLATLGSYAARLEGEVSNQGKKIASYSLVLAILDRAAFRGAF